MALLVRRVPAHQLVASGGEANQPLDRLLTLPMTEPRSLIRLKPRARRYQAIVTGPDGGLDHRLARHPHVERVPVLKVDGGWCRVGATCVREMALRRARHEVVDGQQHPRREAGQRDRRGLCGGRDLFFGKRLVRPSRSLPAGLFGEPLLRSDGSARKADVELQVKGVADFGHALEGRGAAPQDSANRVSVEADGAGGPDR